MKDLAYEEVLEAVRYCSAEHYDPSMISNLMVLRANARILFGTEIDTSNIYKKHELLGYADEKYHRVVQDAFLELEMASA